MSLEKILKAGNEALVKNDQVSFATIIDEIVGPDTLTVIGPIDTAQRNKVRLGHKYLVSCVSEQGVFMFEAMVNNVDESLKLAIFELKMTSPYTKIQRREAFRAKETIDVNARKKAHGIEITKKWVKTNTIDISETGMLLQYDESCPLGLDVEIIIRINRYGINEVLPVIKAKVVRCMQTRNKEHGYLLGLKFENLPEKTRNVIIKLVVLSQRNKLRHKHIKGYGKHGDRGAD